MFGSKAILVQRLLLMPDSSVPSQDQRRTARTNAVKIFNELASAANLTRIAARPPAEAVTTLWASLWKAVPPESRDQLLAAKNSWVENGGAGEFPEAPLPGDEGAADPEDTHVTSEIVDNHRVLQQTFYPTPAKKSFPVAFQGVPSHIQLNCFHGKYGVVG